MLRYSVTDTDECADNLCENNGTCVDLLNGYKCICVAGFNASNCTNSIIYLFFYLSNIFFRGALQKVKINNGKKKIIAG